MPNRPIRVVHVVANFCEGGAQSVVRALTPRSVSEFVEVSVVAVHPCALEAEQKRRLGVPVIEIESRSGGAAGALWRTVRALRELKPDVAHAHAHGGDCFGRAAAALAGVPVIILTEHDADPPPPRQTVRCRVVVTPDLTARQAVSTPVVRELREMRAKRMIARYGVACKAHRQPVALLVDTKA